MSMIAEPMLATWFGLRARAVISMPQPVAPKTAARMMAIIPAGFPHCT